MPNKPVIACFQGFGNHIMTGYPYLPPGGYQKAGEDTHGGRLPRPVEPEETHNLSLWHVKADVIHRQAFAVVFGQIRNHDVARAVTGQDRRDRLIHPPRTF